MDATTLLQTDIIDILGLQHLPAPQKASLLNNMGQVIQERITDRVLEAMSADQRQAFEQLLNTNASAQDIDAFIRASVPDFEQIAAEEVVNFKSAMAQDVATVRKIATAQ